MLASLAFARGDRIIAQYSGTSTDRDRSENDLAAPEVEVVSRGTLRSRKLSRAKLMIGTCRRKRPAKVR